uniref:uncharacterized protein LOC120948559 isoform X1 n=1 Tax=Anopheles coluzzii TaxID=1518534 RepID=UPI0020FFCE51|nr:uncharacterized protein LOC120948559 isoform X1 [Anopheles coluzzii]XP_040220948.2 uncharacterized protein LOC120948559 isoform X1 [Anopheles coluzzii]XP_040220949.2 uncharacterized protein LOC120948559 isoform X1 [Anopheles coluzzii]XP_040220951.2 uncharacterized protein LOC120948559 isoform X1 [Anopheles coluzzii]XP_040220952.2 uncharacterized protein LOC120948559 isoform X1 [Anopheles coluzzii]XP_049463170.1 uncharacterized protein LOC120948559 isoform X1 [Anopheles coluzzii]XP_04946317
MRSMIQPHRKGSRRKVISGCSNHTVGCARNTLKSLLLLHCDDLNIPASVAASTTPDTTVQPATSRISTPSARRRRRRRLDNELVPLGSSVSDGVEGCHCSHGKRTGGAAGCSNPISPTSTTTITTNTTPLKPEVLERYQQPSSSAATLVSVPWHHKSKTKLLYRSIVQICLALFLILGCCDAAKQEVLQSGTGCAFPKRWEGQWFQSGVQQPITIEGSTLSTRGRCIASEGDKFLLVNGKGCHRCVVIYQKHINILQYKESECEDFYTGQLNPAAMPIHSVLKSDRGLAHPNMNGHSRISSSDPYMRSNEDSDNCMGCKGRETLHYLCEQIPGDALLYSMFKINPEPIKCPLSGSYTFTYNRGHGECRYPVSNMEMCTEDSRLLLSFQACPDVPGTESTVEELTCLAWWKDGNSRYLVGLVSHHHATSNEERFRCFVYEKLSGSDAEYKLAQSGDATCNGLESAEVGSRIMTLKKAPLMDRCDFPVWFKGPRFWHALMGSAHYVFDASDGSLHIKKPNGHTVARSLCEQINKQTSSEMMVVVHHTMGCKSGFMCVMFYRRDTHVAELQMGTPAARLEDACTTENFDVHRTPFVTLLANNSETQLCPLEGQYMMKGFLMPTSSISRHKRNHNNKARSHRHWDVVGYRNQESAIASSNAGTVGGIVGGYIGLEAKRRSFLPRSRRTAADSRNDTSTILHGDNGVATDGTARSRRETAGGCNINHNTNRQLLVGCSEESIIEVKPKCKIDDEELFICTGHWQENQTTYIIAKHSISQHGVCISYVPMEGNHVQLFVGDTCHRAYMQSGQHRSMPANITSYGKCGEVNSSIKLHPLHIRLYSFILSLLLIRSILR